MFQQVPYNEAALLRRIANGDEQAFAALVDRYWGKLYTLTLTFLKSADETKELIQDVLLKVWVRREQLPEIEKLDAWLFIITRNEVINRLKKRKLYTEDLLSAVAVSAANSASDKDVRFKELALHINRAVELLPPQQKIIYTLSREEGLSHEEICTRLGLARSSVKNSLVKALAFLRNHLQQYSDIPLAIILFLSSQ